MGFELSEEQEKTLTAFLDSEERDELINGWLKEFGFSPLQSRLMTKILLPLLFKYLGKGGKEGVAWLDDKLKNQFPFYQELSANLTRKILFKIECNDAKAGLLNQHLQAPANVDLNDWAALDEQTQVWIDQLNKLDLIIWSLGDLKAAIKLHLDQPRLSINASPSRLLRPHNAFIPLIGREQETSQLQAWCLTDDSFSWQIIIGEGGMGKTRLAQEFAKNMVDSGWDGGFLAHDLLGHLVDHDHFPNWVPLTDTLIIVDYAATKLDSLKKLIQQCARLARDTTDQSESAKLRLLLLERHADKDQGWLKEILAAGEGALTDDIRDAWQPTLELKPPELKSQYVTMADILRATLISWENFYDKTAPQLPSLDEADFQQLFRNTEGRPLYLQMAALHSCEIGSMHELLHWDRSSLLNDAVERECHYIDKLCGATDAPAKLVRRMAALLFFAGKISTQHKDLFAITVQEAKICGYTQAEPAEIVNTLSLFLGDDNSNGAIPMLNPIQPDLIGAVFAATTLQQGSRFEITLNHAIELGNETAWANLLRSAQDLYAVNGLDALSVEAWLPPLLAGRSKDQLWLIAGLLPKQSVALRAFSVNLYERLLDQSSKEQLEEQAIILNNLGKHYNSLGRREEALAAAKRAVEIRERLSQKNADVFEPDLASSLSTLGSIYLNDDKAAQALEIFAHGIQVLSRLFQQAPAAFDSLMLSLYKNYMASCEQTGQEPDMVLLVPIVEKLQTLDKK